MLNLNILDVLDADTSILKYLNKKEPLETSVSSYKLFRNDLLLLLKEYFDNQADIYELISINTCAMDALLRHLWDKLNLPTEDAALIAIGGYGRRELFPESDIDLMIVLKEEIDPSVTTKIESFLTFLWDINLPIAQSVRTIKDCITEAKKDITVMTSLMELYYLSGNKGLFYHIDKLITEEKIWPSKKFFKEKIIELENRHHKFGDTANHLEPNVKENPGGLRDIHTLRWLTNRYFKTKSFEELVAKDFLTNNELNLIQKAYKNIAKIRFTLHIHLQRGEDRLLFDYQHDIATLLGFKSDNHNHRVEEFMQVFYRNSNQLEILSEIIINRLRSNIFPGLFKRRAKPINEYFQARANLLESTNKNIFTNKPSTILECFQILQHHQNINGFSDQLEQLIIDHLHVIDEEFRSDFNNCNTFISILNQPHTSYREIRRMAQLGVLGKYWPNFDAVTGRMQFDLFHVYTVEEHTLQVFENACKFSEPNANPENETYHDIFTQTPKALILYIAALFHDIAKGRGGDHSDLGAEEVISFCHQHDISEFDTKLISWLVKNHLIMSMTAQNEDIDDPDVIKNFAKNIGNLTRLNYLYLLTIADIRGTNPKLWNNWRSTLLAELYQSTSRYLRQESDSQISHEELTQEVKKSALLKLQKQGIDKKQCISLWQELEDEYFLRHSDEEVVRHTQAILENQDDDRIIVKIHQYSVRGATEIFIYCKDRNYLFAHITSILSKLGISIVHARIITSKTGHALDTFLVLDSNNEPINDVKQCRLVAHQLRELLENPDLIEDTAIQKLPRRVRELRVPIEIHFENNKTKPYTSLELKAPDFPGLLASIGNTFVDCNISVHDARISTLGERVHNIFQISDLDNQPLTEQQQNNISQAIRENLLQPKQISLAV